VGRVNPETSGRDLLASRPLGSTGKHAAMLLPILVELLSEIDATPSEISEVYISVGPGSFTGLRVGITVARTLGQLLPDAKLVAVPTPLAVAETVIEESWDHLGVLLAAKDTTVHATLISRDAAGHPTLDGESQLAPIAELVAAWPNETKLAGEGLTYGDPVGAHQTAGTSPWYPTVEAVFTVGARLAEAGETIDFNHLLPVYARRPEAVRLWEQRHGH
jgi:tRNA threonylcarbamoyladenosine biosynthesis protein TsaB